MGWVLFRRVEVWGEEKNKWKKNIWTKSNPLRAHCTVDRDRRSLAISDRSRSQKLRLQEPLQKELFSSVSDRHLIAIADLGFSDRSPIVLASLKRYDWSRDQTFCDHDQDHNFHRAQSNLPSAFSSALWRESLRDRHSKLLGNASLFTNSLLPIFVPLNPPSQTAKWWIFSWVSVKRSLRGGSVREKNTQGIPTYEKQYA